MAWFLVDTAYGPHEQAWGVQSRQCKDQALLGHDSFLDGLSEGYVICVLRCTKLNPFIALL